MPHKALSSWPWKMVVINKVSPGRLGWRGIWMWEPELQAEQKPSPLSLSLPPLLNVDICCPVHYLHEIFSDKWILSPCYLYKATYEVHNSFDLVSCTTPLSPQQIPCFFCLQSSTWGFTAGAKSNCAYNVKDCCQYPYIMPPYGIHGYVKYTCYHEIYMTTACIQSPWL